MRVKFPESEGILLLKCLGALPKIISPGSPEKIHPRDHRGLASSQLEETQETQDAQQDQRLSSHGFGLKQ